MSVVFADTAYWIALILRDDPWAEAADRATAATGDARLVTTEEVLAEFLAGVSRAGRQTRRRAVEMVRQVLDDPDVSVVHQSHESFIDGLNLYEARLDKQYSLTDCISMSTMRGRRILAVLTNDHHFRQEGFVTLMSLRS